MLYMIPMDAQFTATVRDEQSQMPVAWVTLIGARTGAAVRMEFSHLKPGLQAEPTIIQAIRAMRDPEYMLTFFVEQEAGAIVVWLEKDIPVATPTHEGSESRQ